MSKDPAVLFFIDTWLLATKEMRADCRGWYLNLILHQFDKNDLPDDIEELANLADVRFSEYEMFKQVFKQVLKHKFKKQPNGRLANEYAKSILRRRADFKQKRSLSGKISYFLRYVRLNLHSDENVIQAVKNKIDFNKLDVKNEQMIEQVFKQTFELIYGNGNGNGNGNNNINNLEDYNKLLIEQKTKFEEDMIVVEMMKIWKKYNPSYFEDKEFDYPSCLQIAYKIAKAKGWKKNDIIDFKKYDTLKSWEKIVSFVVLDPFLKNLALKNLVNQFQMIVQKMTNNEKEEKNKNNKENVKIKL